MGAQRKVIFQLRFLFHLKLFPCLLLEELVDFPGTHVFLVIDLLCKILSDSNGISNYLRNLCIDAYILRNDIFLRIHDEFVQDG